MLFSRMWWFGRRLQFNRHVVYNGQENTYTLTKDGVKHKLKPLKDKEEKVCSVTRICFVDGKNFSKV